MSWLPLRRYADFGGRSTRSELIFFYILVVILNVAVSWAALLAGFAAAEWLWALLMLALLVPSLALAVRRLHDTGRGGWWLLLALPSVSLSLFGGYQRYQASMAEPITRMPIALGLPAALSSLALIVLLLWNDEAAPNRYGPNPRYDPPGDGR